MKSTFFALAAAAGTAVAQQQSAYGQCGGQGWTGATTCVSGYHCSVQNAWYSQCIPGTASTTAAAAAVAKTTAKSVAKASTTSAAKAYTTTSAKAAPVSSKTTSAARAPATSAAAAAAPASGKVKYAGINISGFDFGCGTDGTCTTSSIVNPGTTGASQMQHFVTDTGLNAFRLPVGWQYLVNNKLGGVLDATNAAAYDATVQNCIKAGAALCIIDVHNYARWNGQIIGQSNGAVTNAQFTALWSSLATKYKGQSKVAFGIMNEPQGLSDVKTWAATVQAAVTAIRQAGATSNMILLPGNDWTHASSLISDGSYAALKTITNLDGSTTNLVFDVHQYLDSDGSGTHANCVTNNVAAFTTLGNQLRTDKRQALLSETGGGSSDSSCLTDVCQQLEYLAKNSDVYLGWTGWAAGMFDTSYVLSETPTGSAGSYVDQPLVKQCIAGAFKGTATA